MHERGGVVSSLILLAIAAVFAATFVYGIARSEHFLRGLPQVKIILFVLAPLLSLALTAAALLFGPDRKAKAVLLVFSCGISLYLAELALTLGPALRAFAASRTDIDTRCEQQIVLDLRERGIRAYPAVTPAKLFLHRADGTVRSAVSREDSPLLPLGGISRVTTVACNESGRPLIYESDEHGMHNPPGTWDRNDWDVAAVGDSFTHGYCVPSDKNYVALVRRAFPNTVNLGMGGSGPLLNLASLIEFLPELRPRHVLWFHFAGNDNRELEVERKNPLLMRYLNESFTQGLRSKQAIVDGRCIEVVESRIAETGPDDVCASPGGTWKGTLKLSRLRGLLGLTWSVTTLEDPDLFRRVLLKAKAVTESWGGTLHLVYLPHWERYRFAALRGTAQFDSVREEVIRLATDCGVPVIDLHEEFVRHGDPASLYAAHFNERGHAVVAEVVLRVLQDATREAEDPVGRPSSDRLRRSRAAPPNATRVSTSLYR